jgi:transcriptional regulator with PAS, ATPase and Fis domain
VGKEVLAKYIHKHSERSGQYVGLNLAAIPRDLLEGELFGVEKNTATGVSERPGYFEIAEGGTLILDEIGDMHPSVQAKLLRVLEERQFYKVGGREPIPFGARLITATSRDLSDMVLNGEFRRDLYYRINTVRLVIPPLRERQEEVLPHAERILESHSRSADKSGLVFTEEAKDLLGTYSYPGNVRELQNIVRQLISKAEQGSVISAREVRDALNQLQLSRADTLASRSSTDNEVGLEDLLALMSRVKFDPYDSNLRGAMPRVEAAYSTLRSSLLRAVLERYQDPRTGGVNLQGAIQHLTGDPEFRGKKPSRLVNSILGNRQDHRLNQDELKALIARGRKDHSF